MTLIFTEEMTISRKFKITGIRYEAVNFLLYSGVSNSPPIWAIIDTLDKDKIVYSESQNGNWFQQEKDMKVLAELFNADYHYYNELVHHYSISGNKQLSLF